MKHLVQKSIEPFSVTRQFQLKKKSPKSMCDAVIYAILANEDPLEYPLRPMSSPISDYSSAVTEYGFKQTLRNCDCSDPENYSFYDEGRFKI